MLSVLRWSQHGDVSIHTFTSILGHIKIDIMPDVFEAMSSVKPKAHG